MILNHIEGKYPPEMLGRKFTQGRVKSMLHVGSKKLDRKLQETSSLALRYGNGRS